MESFKKATNDTLKVTWLKPIPWKTHFDSEKEKGNDHDLAMEDYISSY